ncbi:MAG: hypothetical protein RL113_521 [Pseudomonadota bacterium]|jgi:phytoene dehydrogenase-like protein
MNDYAVVGSGIGGSTIAAYLDKRGFKTVLFEKEPYLGGCSSTFSHHGFKYNTGATTFVGYQEGHPVKEMFDAMNFTPSLTPTDPAIVVIHEKKVTPRYHDLEQFLIALEKNYPHHTHKKFWKLLYEINASFYQIEGYTYSNSSKFKKFISMLSYFPLFLKFRKYLHMNAHTFIEKFYGVLSEEYTAFLEAQVLIVAQASLKEINFLTAALALGYTFNKTYTVDGGFSHLFDQLTDGMEHIERSTAIQKIEKENGFYILHTKNKRYKAKNVILNTTIYDSQKLFEDKKIQSYYAKYEKLDNHQSSFMVYMTIKSDQHFEHHYQLIQKEQYPFTISNALFVSFSTQDDLSMAPQGHYSITASIHTDYRDWEDKERYKEQKEMLKNQLIKSICDILDIRSEEIVDAFAATPKTFQRYINRKQLGGNAMTMKNFLPKLPANDTPIEGLYQVGDSVYPGQGWPGVTMGVKNLIRILGV